VDKDIKKIEGSEQSPGEKTEEKKKRKLKPIFWVIIALAVAVAGTSTYFLWPETGVEVDIRERVPTGRGYLLTPDNIEEMRRMVEEHNPDAQFTVSMTTTWRFETALTPSRTAEVDNLATNSRTVYFDVILRDTNQLVYSSPYMPLGSTLDNFALDVNLAAGVYDAIARFSLVDDDYEFITDVSVAVRLVINN
jgi:hypothetical protein